MQILQDATVETIEALVDDEVSESHVLDFKSELPKSAKESNDDLHEFLKDVTSFSNGEGGQLIYGVEEKKDSDGKDTGIAGDLVPIHSLSDANVKPLQQAILNCVTPRLHGVVFNPIIGNDSGYLVVTVPKSLNGPHMVRRGKHKRFYKRHNTLSDEMSYDEIKNSFYSRFDIEDRLTKRRDQRLQDILDRKFFHNYSNQAFSFVQLISIPTRYEPCSPEMMRKFIYTLCFPQRDKWTRRENLDGVYADFGSHRYVQIYRNGSVERLDTIYTSLSQSEDPHTFAGKVHNLIDGGEFSRDLLYFIMKALDEQSAIEVNPPVVLLMSLHGVLGRSLHPIPLGPTMSQMLTEPPGFDRNDLYFEPIVLSDPKIDRKELAELVLTQIWSASDSRNERDLKGIIEGAVENYRLFPEEAMRYRK